jgi:hypothetical protein
MPLPLFIFLLSFVANKVWADQDYFPTAKQLLSKSLQQHQIENQLKIPKASNKKVAAVSTTNTGYFYYKFYDSQSCHGDVTYTAGILANTCLPADDYKVPNVYYYYYKSSKSFESFQILNLAGKKKKKKNSAYFFFYWIE